MMANAISVRNLSKTFRIPTDPHNTLKQTILSLGRQNHEKLLVLDDISFEIRQGEFFGIVGRNGSGKSTLLKLLAGIYTQTSGHIDINGHLTPFIELGIGFNPELSGRDNVFLNGAILGLTEKEVEAKYQDVVDFAELERFMDQKLKNYSSGMQVRLAFSIAIQARNEILLIDEVLAVGDIKFQEKCFAHFDKLKRQDRSIVFVTHDMSAVERFCDRALLIDNGKIKAIGTPNDIASLYLLNTTGGRVGDVSGFNKEEGIELVGIEMVDGKSKFSNDDKVVFDITYRLTKKLDHHIGIGIIKEGLSIHERNTVGLEMPQKPGEYRLRWLAPASSLTKGLHHINVAAFKTEGFRLVAYINDGNRFVIEKPTPTVGGMLDMHSDWELQK